MRNRERKIFNSRFLFLSYPDFQCFDLNSSVHPKQETPKQCRSALFFFSQSFACQKWSMPIECSTECCLPSVFVSCSFSMRSSTMLFINVVSHVQGNCLLIVALFVRIWCRMNPTRPTQQRRRAASTVGIIVDIVVVVVPIVITIVTRTRRRHWRWSVVIVARTPMNISDRRNLLFMNRWVRASEQTIIGIFVTNPRPWAPTRIDPDHKWFSKWTVAVGNGIPPYRWPRWLIWPVVYGMRPRRPTWSARESTPSLPLPTVEPNIPRPVDRRLPPKIRLIKHRSC